MNQPGAIHRLSLDSLGSGSAPVFVEALGHQTVTFQRFQTGSLEPGDIEEGQYKISAEEKIQRIFSVYIKTHPMF